MIKPSFVEDSYSVNDFSNNFKKQGIENVSESKFSSIFEDKVSEIENKALDQTEKSLDKEHSELAKVDKEVSEFKKEEPEQKTKQNEDEFKKDSKQVNEKKSETKDLNSETEIKKLKSEKSQDAKQVKSKDDEKEKVDFKPEKEEKDSDLDFKKIAETKSKENIIPIKNEDFNFSKNEKEIDLKKDFKLSLEDPKKITQSADKKIQIHDLRDTKSSKENTALKLNTEVLNKEGSSKESIVVNLEQSLDNKASSNINKNTFIQKFDNYLKAEGMSDIVEKAKFILKNNDNGEINLRLKPGNLGSVKILMQINDNSVSGKIVVENHAVRQLFESNMASLQKSFEEKGFEFQSFDLSYSDENKENSNEETQKDVFSKKNILKIKTSSGIDSFNRLSIYEDDYKKINMVI